MPEGKNWIAELVLIAVICSGGKLAPGFTGVPRAVGVNAIEPCLTSCSTGSS